MHEQDALHRRGHALEDEYFRRVDEELRKKLIASIHRDEARKQLQDATGFQNEELLDHLLDAGIEATQLAALSLVPAIFVAWADGSVTAQERQVILSEALHHGVDREPVAFQLVESWLKERPGRDLWRLWREYATAVRQSLSPVLATTVTNEILRQAQAVAEASRRTFDFKRVSDAEQKVLDELTHALEADLCT